MGEFLRAGVVVQEGRIAAVGGEPPADAERVDCTRFAVVPGMVNAHCHSNENRFRGLWDNLPLEPWMLFSYPVLAAPPQSPDEIYVRTLLGGIEMIRSGATCVVDFLYELQGFTDDSLAETRMQALSGRRMYGRTLVEHLDRIGFLGPRICFEHGIWLTPHDVELVRDRGVTVVHNPVSNMKLGSGICPVPTLLAEGVNVALGTDGMSSNDGNDMFATLKAAALLHKLWEIDYERWLGAEEAWRMATAAGARAAGDADGLGTIEAGRRADLVLLDLESMVFTPLNDPLRQLALGSTTLAVDSTLVGGRWVLRGGQVTGVGEAAILEQGRELGRELVARHDEGFRVGQQLLASVRAGWLEALGADVGVRRSPPL